MSLRSVALVVGVVAVCGTGVAVAAHQQVDPATATPVPQTATTPTTSATDLRLMARPASQP